MISDKEYLFIQWRNHKVKDAWVREFENDQEARTYVKERFEKFPEIFMRDKIVVAKIIDEVQFKGVKN